MIVAILLAGNITWRTGACILPTLATLAVAVAVLAKHLPTRKLIPALEATCCAPPTLSAQVRVLVGRLV